MASLEADADTLAKSYQPPPTGRPSDLADRDTVAELVKQLALGNRRDVACDLAGIHRATFYRWLKTAETDPDSPESAFATLVKRAESQAEARIVGNVLKASEKEAFWAAGMTYLERSRPEHWGKRSEDGNSPKVIVQIGVQATEVSVTFASHASLSPVSHNDLPCANPAQVEMLGLISGPVLTTDPPTVQTLPAVSRGHGLTEPAGVSGGIAPDGSGDVKASRRRGRKEKKA